MVIDEEKRFYKTPSFWVASIVLLVMISLSVFMAIKNISTSSETGSVDLVRELDNRETIYFQDVIDDWVAKRGKNVAVDIFDLDASVVVGEYNVDKEFNSASLYKLPVVYAGYIRIANELDTLGLEKDDPAADREFLYPGSKNSLSRAECLDIAIRESDSVCAEKLAADIGWTEINQMLDNFDIEGLLPQQISTTAAGMNNMLKVVYNHAEITPNLSVRLFDSMLYQPKTLDNGGDYINWRQGLPSGFSPDVKVYDKVGWASVDGENWSLFHDAAIIEIGNRHYAITVLTENTNPSEIKKLAQKIEAKIRN